jgi:hypothetical protein
MGFSPVTYSIIIFNFILAMEMCQWIPDLCHFGLSEPASTVAIVKDLGNVHSTDV